MNYISSDEAQKQWNSIFQLRTYFSTHTFNQNIIPSISPHTYSILSTLQYKRKFLAGASLFSKAHAPAPRPTTLPIQRESGVLAKRDKMTTARRWPLTNITVLGLRICGALTPLHLPS